MLTKSRTCMLAWIYALIIDGIAVQCRAIPYVVHFRIYTNHEFYHVQVIFRLAGENDLLMKQSTLLPQAIRTLAARGIYALY